MEIAEKLQRFNSHALDDILGVPFKVLDQGFVRVVDYMGTDESIVQAARVSYGKGTKKVSEDRGLIRYLLRHSHTTPLEMCVIKFHVKVPMDCWRQWIRHRMSSVNEYSTRYSEAIDACQETAPEEWRIQSKNNKQGSAGTLMDSMDTCDFTPTGFSEEERQFHKTARELYEKRLKAGIAKEQARKDLPLSNYTEAYWKIDLHNLLHFLSLRMDKHAQKEIRDYANVIGNEIVSKWVPFAWEAFNDYNFRRDALLLTSMDKNIIGLLARGNREGALTVATQYGWLERKEDGSLKTNRERSEFEEKASELGIILPW